MVVCPVSHLNMKCWHALFVQHRHQNLPHLRHHHRQERSLRRRQAKANVRVQTWTYTSKMYAPNCTYDLDEPERSGLKETFSSWTQTRRRSQHGRCKQFPYFQSNETNARVYNSLLAAQRHAYAGPFNRTEFCSRTQVSGCGLRFHRPNALRVTM